MGKRQKAKAKSSAPLGGPLLGGRHDTGRCPFGEVIRSSQNGFLLIEVVEESNFRGWRIVTRSVRGKFMTVEHDILEDGLAESLAVLREVKDNAGTTADA